MTSKGDFMKKFAVLLLIFSCCLVFAMHAFAGTIVVKPGPFDHFTVQIPDRSVAGENFVVKIQAYDANKNLITNFSETGKEFKVETGGSATLQPSVIVASSFSGGTANIIINDRKAERFVFAIRESGGTVPVISREITVLPNKLDHFQMQAPKTATAGAAFDVSVVAKDLYDNMVLDGDIGRNIKVTSSGTSSVKIVGGTSLDFKNGTANASFLSEKTGDVVIEVKEAATGSMGKTSTVTVLPAPLALFKLQAPRTAVAGEPFDLQITAYDAFDNVVTNYAAAGSGVRISSSGSSKVEPMQVNASSFNDGQASVRVSYEKAETIAILVKENNRDQSGKTADIAVANAEPDHFVVVTPETALSGQQFKLKIEAYDRFNNIVRNFNLIGSDVLLNTTGTGTITPSKVSSAEFVDGVAMVGVAYDKAESFQITAASSGEKSHTKLSVHEQPRTEVGTAPRKEKISSAEKKTAKKKETEKPAKLPSSTSEAKPRTRTSPPPVEQQKTAPQAKAVPQKETRQETPVAAKSPEPKQEAKAEPAKPAPEKKAEKQHLYTISNVSVVESKSKAMLVINVNNPNGSLEFSDEIETRLGKEWLRLKVRPTVNNAGKSFKFKSAFIGDVLVEQGADAQNTVYFLVELLPSGLTYDVARVKNSLIVTFANP